MLSLSESPEEEEEVDTFETEKSAPKITSSFLSSISQPTSDIVSPRKRTQTLPSLGGPPGFRTSKEPSCDRWSYLHETLEEKDEKTFSEDIFKILDLHKVTLFQEKQNGNDRDKGKDGMQERRRSNGAVKPTEPQQEKVETQAQPKGNMLQSSPPLSRLEIVKLQPQNVIEQQGDNMSDHQQLITRFDLNSLAL